MPDAIIDGHLVSVVTESSTGAVRQPKACLRHDLALELEQALCGAAADFGDFVGGATDLL
jgi:hypothetical protein